jgi:hypothetical protein
MVAKSLIKPDGRELILYARDFVRGRVRKSFSDFDGGRARSAGAGRAHS